VLSTNAVAGVRCFDDLIAYQLAVGLRDAVYAMTAGTVEARDRRFRDQIRDAAASAPRNLAEGFGRFSPREFARFATIARGSITETQNHLRHGLRQRYFSQSIDSVEGPPERRELLRIISDGVASTAASLKLGVGPPQRFDSMIDIIAQSCATLHE